MTWPPPPACCSAPPSTLDVEVRLGPGIDVQHNHHRQAGMQNKLSPLSHLSSLTPVPWCRLPGAFVQPCRQPSSAALPRPCLPQLAATPLAPAVPTASTAGRRNQRTAAPQHSGRMTSIRRRGRDRETLQQTSSNHGLPLRWVPVRVPAPSGHHRRRTMTEPARPRRGPARIRLRGAQPHPVATVECPRGRGANTCVPPSLPPTA